MLTVPSPPQNLYDSIRNEPFKIPEDDGTDLTHTFSTRPGRGWLLKLGTSFPDCWLPLKVGKQQAQVLDSAYIATV